jgi:hypothetical protein
MKVESENEIILQFLNRLQLNQTTVNNLTPTEAKGSPVLLNIASLL